MARQATLADFFSKPQPKKEGSKGEEGFLAQLKKQINDSPDTPNKFKSRTASLQKETPPKRKKNQTDSNPRPNKKAKTQCVQKFHKTYSQYHRFSNTTCTIRLGLGSERLAEEMWRMWNGLQVHKAVTPKLLLSPGNEQDEACHQKFHKKSLSPLAFAVSQQLTSPNSLKGI